MQEYDYSRTLLSVPSIIERRNRPLRVTPVIETADAVLDPLDAYMRLKKPGAASFLFESADLGGKSARFSFIGSTSAVIGVKNGSITINGANVSYKGGAVAFLKDLMSGFEPGPAVFLGEEAPLPVFFGGLAGYLSYDFIRYFDNIGSSACDDIGCMDAELVLADEVAVFDHRLKKLLLIANDFSYGKPNIESAKGRIERMKATLSRPQAPVAAPKEPQTLDVTYPTSRERYMEMVKRAKEYILDGDAFQIVLSQRAEVTPISTRWSCTAR